MHIEFKFLDGLIRAEMTEQFVPCPGCDQYECITECMYPGALDNKRKPMPDRLSPEAQAALDKARILNDSGGLVTPLTMARREYSLLQYTDAELLAELTRRLSARP